jgi:hypothetical protein
LKTLRPDCSTIYSGVIYPESDTADCPVRGMNDLRAVAYSAFAVDTRSSEAGSPSASRVSGRWLIGAASDAVGVSAVYAASSGCRRGISDGVGFTSSATVSRTVVVGEAATTGGAWVASSVDGTLYEVSSVVRCSPYSPMSPEEAAAWLWPVCVAVAV